MIAMKPIADQNALDLFNKGRFLGPVQGYVASDGAGCVAYCLFLVEEKVTCFLYAQAQDTALLDGILRAAAAKGEADGAQAFTYRPGCDAIEEWFRVFFKEVKVPVPNNLLFGGCCG